MADWRHILLVAAFATTASCAKPEPRQPPEAEDRTFAEQQARQEFERALRERILSGDADPRADALARAGSGKFGLISTGQYSLTPPGVICFTPYRAAPELLAGLRHGDSIGKEEGALIGYARSYNVVIVSLAGYPYADLCRLSTEADRQLDWREALVVRAARPVSGPPRDLHEAARRGTVQDVRRFLKATSPDALDGLKMSALSWAIARNNRPAVEALLRAGADPLAGGLGEGGGALQLAAVLGRGKEFERLLARVTPELQARYWGSEVISASFMSAAVASDNEAIVRAIRARPHNMLRPSDLRKPLPSKEVLELVLKVHRPDLADELLVAALNQGDRLDLVRLALANGADPNRISSYESPLTLASRAFDASSPEAVDLLIEAGADVNLMAHRERPAWVATRGMMPDRWQTGRQRRARQILLKLVKAGADLNLPDWRGMPPIWSLLVPPSAANEEIDESYATAEVLGFLVANGMDVNATWRGRRILALAEAQRDPASELVRTLRALGAK